jgi:ATP-binding cassette subfamily F protein 3
LLVSHDRQLLNAATTSILHLDIGKLTLYSGNFDAYLRARSEAKARQQAVAKRQDAQRKHMQAFVDRFRYKASKARQAQSRLKALAKLEPVAVIAEAPPIELRLPEPTELRPPLITLEKASVGYAEDKPVLAGLDLRLDPDDRVALLGANGNGKTTFARLLAGRLPAMAGHVTRPSKLITGYFAQHQIEEMRPDDSAYDHLAALLPQLNEEAVRARLGAFGFGQDKAFVPVSALSGGERARLNLALVTHDAPALLILDEPTNHLDMETRESLVEALADYAGAVVLVSHDWHLVELVADRLWLVENSTVRPFDGDLDAYRRRLDERDAAEDERDAKTGERDPKRQARREAAQVRLALEPLRRESRRAEQAAAQLAAEQKDLDHQLAAPHAFGGGPGLAEALRRRADLVRRIAEAEAQWFAAEEAIERAARG